MSARFSGRVAVVTGASSGIGRATALALAAEGARIVLGGRDPGELEGALQAVRAKGVEARALAGDLGRAEHPPALIGAAMETFGRLDLLVNAAGVGHPGPAVHGQDEHWREMLATNFFGLALTCRAAARVMAAHGGAIVNVSALAGSEASPGWAFYSATKHAVNGFSASLRLELTGANIRVLVIEPGPTMSSFLRNIPHAELARMAQQLGLPAQAVPNFEGRHVPPAFAAAALQALRERFLAPEEVAHAILRELLQPTPALEKLRLTPDGARR